MTCEGLYARVQIWTAFSDGHALPKDLQALTTLPNDGSAGPLDKVPQDSWGHPFMLKLLGKKKFEVLSRGPDGIEGTDDDIVYAPAH